MYMKKKGYFKANGIRYKGIVALAGWLRVQTMGEYRHCDGLPALRKYFFGIPHCQHSLFSFGTLLTPPTKRTSPIYITTFWAGLFQIYALFGALFTGRNSVAVYQNLQKSVMVIDETFVTLGYVALMLDLIFTVVLLGPQGSTMRSELCSLWSSCWSFVWLQLFGRNLQRHFWLIRRSYKLFPRVEISQPVRLLVSSWSAMTSTNIFFKRGEE